MRECVVVYYNAVLAQRFQLRLVYDLMIRLRTLVTAVLCMRYLITIAFKTEKGHKYEYPKMLVFMTLGRVFEVSLNITIFV